jgi:nitrite reductase (NADH) small subunit
LEDFPPGSHKIVQAGGRSIGIYNIAGSIFAVQNVCPHALAPICIAAVTGTYMPSRPGEFIYGMDGQVLRCPWHGWEFDIRTGEALFSTDKRKLATFPVSIANGKVLILMRTKNPTSRGDQSQHPAESDVS